MAILVVDDEEDSREMMVSLLEECGASAAAAASAAEALELIARMRPAIMLSDSGMPGEDGYALIRKVRLLPTTEGGAIPAVAVSGYASVDDRKRALAAGFQMHLSKPVSVSDSGRDDCLESVAHGIRGQVAIKLARPTTMVAVGSLAIAPK